MAEIENKKFTKGGAFITEDARPEEIFTPDLTCVQNLNIYQREPVLIPERFVAQTDQRPLER